MQTIQRLLIALWSALTRAFQFWARDIARRKTLTGKALSGCLGLLVILCACSVMLAAAQGAGESVGLLPTRTPTSAPTARPSATTTPLVAAPTAQAPTAAAPTTPPPTIAPATAPVSTTTSAPTLAPPAATAAPPPIAHQAAAGDVPTLPEDLPSAMVARVVDGDTMDVTLEGQTVRVRLIGIDTPETVDPRQPIECFGREASAQAHALLDGQTVFLEEDPSQDSVDQYGRALRYVWMADGRLFNLEMVAQGYAFEYTYDVPYKYQVQFKQAERDAREQQLGLWAPTTCGGQHIPAAEPPAATTPPQATPAPTAVPAQTPVSAPEGGVTITRAPGTVRRGATATVAAHTAPSVQCSIVVRYKSRPSKAQGLGPKTADEGGDVAWSWKVGTNTTPGAWPVIITCGEAAARTEVVVP